MIFVTVNNKLFQSRMSGNTKYVENQHKKLVTRLICQIKKIYNNGNGLLRFYNLFTYVKPINGVYKFVGNIQNIGSNPLETIIDGFPSTVFQGTGSALNYAVGAPWYAHLRDGFHGELYCVHLNSPTVDAISNSGYIANYIAVNLYNKCHAIKAPVVRDSEKWQEFINSEWSRIMGNVTNVRNHILL